jgi:hypothetical protein
MTPCVSMLLKSSASSDMFLSASLTRKTCNSTHEQTPLSNNTIDSVLGHGDVGWAKDLSASLIINIPMDIYIYIYIYTHEMGLFSEKMEFMIHPKRLCAPEGFIEHLMYFLLLRNNTAG